MVLQVKYWRSTHPGNRAPFPPWSCHLFHGGRDEPHEVPAKRMPGFSLAKAHWRKTPIFCSGSKMGLSSSRSGKHSSPSALFRGEESVPELPYCSEEQDLPVAVEQPILHKLFLGGVDPRPRSIRAHLREETYSTICIRIRVTTLNRRAVHLPHKPSKLPAPMIVGRHLRAC